MVYSNIYIYILDVYVPGSKVAIWEMVILPSKGNPYIPQRYLADPQLSLASLFKPASLRCQMTDSGSRSAEGCFGS